jgi:hypothetical protein
MREHYKVKTFRLDEETVDDLKRIKLAGRKSWNLTMKLLIALYDKYGHKAPKNP